MPLFCFAAFFISINTNALHLWGYYTIKKMRLQVFCSRSRTFCMLSHLKRYADILFTNQDLLTVSEFILRSLRPDAARAFPDARFFVFGKFADQPFFKSFLIFERQHGKHNKTDKNSSPCGDSPALERNNGSASEKAVRGNDERTDGNHRDKKEKKAH